MKLSPSYPYKREYKWQYKEKLEKITADQDANLSVTFDYNGRTHIKDNASKKVIIINNL